MRRYETIFIVDPDVSEEQRGALFERLGEIVTQFDGFLVERDEWGMRKLAYDIRKRNRGYYVRLDYCGDGPLVDEIERSFRIDDKILKYMTIVLDKDVDVARIKEELAKAAEEKAAAAAPAEKEKAAPVVENESETVKTETEVENKEA